MNCKDFLTRLEQIIDASPGILNGNESLADLGGWDSLAKVQLQAFLDEELHVQANPGRIEACKTVQDLMNLAGISVLSE